MTDAATEALKPCPFCGGDELSHGWSYPGVDGSEHTGEVQCHTCDALLWKPTEAEAIAAWNTRALSTPTPAGELREVYRHKARGTLYEVIASAELQAATGDVEEGAILTIYQGADGKVWARRAREFGDGRFERVSSALAQPGSGEGV